MQRENETIKRQWILVCLAVVGLAVPCAFSQTCVPPPGGLVSWWTADGTTADFLGLNDGLSASPVSYADGEVADAFSFNGSQYVQVPRSLSLEPSAITVDAWVKADASPGTFRYLVAKGAVDDVASSYALYTGASGGLLFYVFDGTVPTFSPNAGTGVWDGTWHHVAGTFDGITVRLFLDGSEVGSGTPASISIAYGLTGGNDLFVGDFNPGCGGCTEHSFAGEVDELEIFQRALPANSIASIFAAGQAGKCLPVGIDIRAKRFRHGREEDSEDDFTLVILGSAAFDTADVVRSTILLSHPADRHRSKGKRKCRLQDVNGDTFKDLVCEFDIEGRHHREKDATVIVTGQVLVPGGERTFFGVDTIDLDQDEH